MNISVALIIMNLYLMYFKLVVNAD